MKYLLDTTVVSDVANHIGGVLERLLTTPRADIAVSTVTAMEVEFGLLLNPARTRKIEGAVHALLECIRVLPYERPDAHVTAAIRAALRHKGTPIGPYEVMIASTALRHGLVMVTSNRREFERIDGLVVEDWR